MTPKPNDTSESLRLLQKTGLENAELRERGARLEFQAMQYELASGQAFTLNVEFPSRKPVPAPSVSNISAVTRALAENPHLPALDIPLGRIAFSRVAETLPVIAMLCPDIDSKSLAAYFLDMLEEHHRKPFAKLLFVCKL